MSKHSICHLAQRLLFWVTVSDGLFLKAICEFTDYVCEGQMALLRARYAGYLHFLCMLTPLDLQYCLS